ncbi:MAG TPA: hypothetical protein VFQ35_13325 [Polyangiaceae bacterium]|nr:hypothetical protein [Polyangiaceae bacterium]
MLRTSLIVSFFNSPWLKLAVLLAAGATSSGCYARTQGYVVAEAPPAYVETYPSYYYEGRTVYLVDGRWYTRDSGHWVYYRHEPPELYRYRSVRVAPPARRVAPRVRVERREYRYSAPPVERNTRARRYHDGGPRRPGP